MGRERAVGAWTGLCDEGLCTQERNEVVRPNKHEYFIFKFESIDLKLMYVKSADPGEVEEICQICPYKVEKIGENGKRMFKLMRL